MPGRGRQVRALLGQARREQRRLEGAVAGLGAELAALEQRQTGLSGTLQSGGERASAGQAAGQERYRQWVRTELQLLAEKRTQVQERLAEGREQVAAARSRVRSWEQLEANETARRQRQQVHEEQEMIDRHGQRQGSRAGH